MLIDSEKMIDLVRQDYASSAGIEVFSPVSHTLFNPADIIEKVSKKFLVSIEFGTLCINAVICWLSGMLFSL